ncbi:MAG: enoyl-CoA hydratase/isomerase family protein [Ruminococcus flavefaciens]|nr:enoyl-CoA hydratase/isomerase family protein [Ruminococcus flavefaciens]
MIKSNISTLDKYSERIAVLTLENGSKNLLSEPEFIRQEVLTDWLAENPEIQAMIITGAGRHFSHGADVSQFAEGNADEISRKLDKAKSLLNVIENLPVLTAAAINGGCFGGGLEIALSCNFRICSPKAFLGLPEIMHGVIPGMGGIERSVRLLGKEKALQMCLCGEIMTAQQALEIGLVTKITEQKNALGETAEFLDELLKGKSDLQIRAITETVNRTIRGDSDPSGNSFADVLKEVQSR